MSVLKLKVEEGGSITYACTLKDGDGVVIALAAISSLKATLYDKDKDEIINSRDAASVLNTGGGTVHATSGAFTLDLLAADNEIRDATKTTEEHILLLQLQLGNGKTRKWQRKVVVTNLHRVP